MADTFATYVNMGYGLDNLSMIEGWIVMLGYTLQIYFDFSGYTDMALGSAKMLNIDLPINFDSPYKANSIQDFWRRWHMTLSRFLRDYIYIPLGGSRNGTGRTYLNLLTTMLIGGLWHGASWMFVIWGGLHGLALCINRVWQKTKIEFSNWINVLITFMFINFTWIIFRANNFAEFKKVLYSLVNINNFIIPKKYNLDFRFGDNNYENIILLIPLALLLIFCFKNSNQIIANIKLHNKNNAILISFIFAVIFTIAFIKMIVVPYSEFIYFNF